MGTPAGELFGVPHTGKSFKIMAIDIQTIKDGKIAQTFHMENWLSALGRHRRQSRHGAGADSERSHFRHHRRALRRDHDQSRPGRANQFRHLPDDPHEPGAGDRGHVVKSSEPPGGMGETGTSGIVPAIANAIFAATGKRLRKMPVDANALKQPV